MIRSDEAEKAGTVERGSAAYRLADGRYRLVGSAATAPSVPPPRRKVAVLAIHGMGQQVPFETLERVADRLTEMDRGAAATAASSGPPPILTNVAFGELRAQRIEIVLGRGEREVEVHLYEGYWAPLTEGEVSLRDVFRFLSEGAWNALRHLGTPLYRWMFGGPVRFRPPVLSFLALLAATLAMMELVALNLLIPLVVLARLASRNWAPERFFKDVTALTDAILILLLLSGVILWIALRVHGATEIPWLRGVVQAVSIVTFVPAVLAGLGLLPAIIWLWLGHSLPFGLRSRIPWPEYPPSIFLTWALLLLVSWRIRYFLIQYVGDVSAYVSPQYLDRFAELRRKIKESVGGVAKGIFGAETAPDRFEYERIALVGHSLGSVVAYDVANRLILDDALGLSSSHSAERLGMLLTFGSPLDKTAVIFGLHGKETGLLREQLAARVQPLIEDYGYRSPTWVNVYSPFDILAGRLNLYDDVGKTESRGRTVINLPDPEAAIPLAAHTQYWATDVVWEALHEELVAPGAARRRATELESA